MILYVNILHIHTHPPHTHTKDVRRIMMLHIYTHAHTHAHKYICVHTDAWRHVRRNMILKRLTNVLRSSGIPISGATALTRSRKRYIAVLHCVAVCCSVLQCVAVCCSVLQCVAVCCSVLQCVAVLKCFALQLH